MAGSNLWATNGGVFFGFGVEPIGEPPDQSILDMPWEIGSNKLNLYPNPFYAGSVGDRHLLTIGPNGSGKTRRILIPNLFRLQNWSAVVIDIKGELAAHTAAFRAKQENHEVVVIDPFGVMKANYPRLVEKYPYLKSNGLNPVAALDPKSDDFPDDATRLAEAMIRVEGNEPHWAESAQDLVAALIMYVRLTKPGTGSLADVREHLGKTAAELRATVLEMRVTAKEKSCEELGIKAGRFADLTGENRELNSILSAALTQTRWLDSRAIKTDISRGAFDFSALKSRPKTIYLILPPKYLTTHATWLRVMITSALLPLMRSVEKSSVPVLFMLDEFSQLGHMAVIENNMAMLRGYGVKLWPVFQDLAQAKAIYKDRWESFIANAGVIHSFAPQDVTTSDYLSKLSGQRLYWMKTGGTSSSQNMGGQSSISAGTSETLQNMQGPVCWPHGLARMDVGQCVLFSRGRVVRAWLPDPEDGDDLMRLRQLMQDAKSEIAGN